MYNVNIMVIYFLLCCIYGNFLINMEWSFIFYQKCWNVLHCIFHYYCGIVFFSHSEVSFSWENRVLFKEECWRSGRGFSIDYFTMFAVCAPYCVFTSPLLGASGVRRVAQPHPERHDQATRRILTAYIWIEAHYFFWEHRTPPSTYTKAWSLRGTNRHQLWL